MDIRIKKPGFDLKPNVFYDGIDGYIFLVREIDTKTDSLFDITLFQEPTNNKKRAYIRAEQGLLKSEGVQGLTLILRNGEILRYLERNRKNKLENQEITSFSKYRLTFDLSDLKFTKSDRTGRSNSDRTMSAQAMTVVVDTLTKEVESYVDRSSRNTSFTYVYEATNRKPFISKYDLNFNSDTVFITNIEVETKNIVPDYYALQFLTKNTHRKRIIDLARNNVQQDKSYFDSNSSNILWRIKRISRYLVEIHKKFSIPMACVVFVLIGASIGMMTRNGNFGYAALISAIILTIYWISIIQGEKLADRLFISPFIGMWAFNIVFSCIGILLILQLTTGINFKNLFPKRAETF
jgi:lipopolysaccharide export system permease protein